MSRERRVQLSQYYRSEFPFDRSQQGRDLHVLQKRGSMKRWAKRAHSFAERIDGAVSRFLEMPVRGGPELTSYAKSEFLDSSTIDRDLLALVPRKETFIKKLANTRTQLMELELDRSPQDVLAYTLDKEICGATQLDALTCLRLGMDKKTADTIVGRRIFNAGATFLQIAGIGASNFGLSEHSPTKLIAAGGLALTFAGKTIENHVNNANGNDIHKFMEEKAAMLRPHVGLVQDHLIHSGISEKEVTILERLPSALYSIELDSMQLEKVANWGILGATGTDMVAYGEPQLAFLMLSAGLVINTYGKVVYERFYRPRVEKARMADSSGVQEQIKKLGKEHVRMTDANNTLYRLDDLFKMFLYGFKGEDPNLLANVSGINTGLTGFKEAFGRERRRLDYERTIDTVKRIADYLQSPYQLISESSFQKHCRQDVEPLQRAVSFRRGLVIDHLTPLRPDGGKTDIQDATLELPVGSIAVVEARSSSGKSLLLSAIEHNTEHSHRYMNSEGTMKTGGMYVVKEGRGVNMHTFSKEEIKEQIKVVHPGKIRPNIRLIDELKDDFNKFVYKDHPQFDSHDDQLLWETAINSEDTLLEDELDKIDHKEFRIPGYMRNPLHRYRNRRMQWLNDALVEAGGSMAKEDMSAVRTYGSLSDGQKSRFAVLAARIKSELNPAIIGVFLDEPYAGIDADENLELQFKAVRAIRDAGKAVCLFTHIYTDEAATAYESNIFNLETKERREPQVTWSPLLMNLDLPA